MEGSPLPNIGVHGPLLPTRLVSVPGIRLRLLQYEIDPDRAHHRVVELLQEPKVREGAVQFLANHHCVLHPVFPGHPAVKNGSMEDIYETVEVSHPLFFMLRVVVIYIPRVASFFSGKGQFGVQEGFVIEHLEEPVEGGRFVSDLGGDKRGDLLGFTNAERLEDTEGRVDGQAEAMLPSLVAFVIDHGFMTLGFLFPGVRVALCVDVPIELADEPPEIPVADEDVFHMTGDVDCLLVAPFVHEDGARHHLGEFIRLIAVLFRAKDQSRVFVEFKQEIYEVLVILGGIDRFGHASPGSGIVLLNAFEGILELGVQGPCGFLAHLLLEGIRLLMLSFFSCHS